MKKILITGGTLFVSRYIAEYYANTVLENECEVYVMNRNTHEQVEGVKLIECDKNNIGDKLAGYDFDLVIAVNIYTKDEMKNLIDALEQIKDFVFISSSAVYPETLPQPFKEEMETGSNSIWGNYGINKAEAEQYLLEHVPQAYILRPPYLYGKMNNVYREAFVFDCALVERPFFIPNDGSMKLQFFHVKDLCRFIDTLMRLHPEERIFNVGNPKIDDINSFVKTCYKAVGSDLKIINVGSEHIQRSYFPFHDYSYELDVSKMSELMPDTMSLYEGIKDSFRWYKNNSGEILKKAYMDYIDNNIYKDE